LNFQGGGSVTIELNARNAYVGKRLGHEYRRGGEARGNWLNSKERRRASGEDFVRSHQTLKGSKKRKEAGRRAEVQGQLNGVEYRILVREDTKNVIKRREESSLSGSRKVKRTSALRPTRKGWTLKGGAERSWGTTTLPGAGEVPSD